MAAAVRARCVHTQTPQITVAPPPLRGQHTHQRGASKRPCQHNQVTDRHPPCFHRHGHGRRGPSQSPHAAHVVVAPARPPAPAPIPHATPRLPCAGRSDRVGSSTIPRRPPNAPSTSQSPREPARTVARQPAQSGGGDSTRLAAPVGAGPTPRRPRPRPSPRRGNRVVQPSTPTDADDGAPPR